LCKRFYYVVARDLRASFAEKEAAHQAQSQLEAGLFIAQFARKYGGAKIT